ncbi:MAG: class II fumarate hydratase [Pseudomonadota bacterium]
MAETRIEKDSMGELAVPVDALYGAQTQRAIENFPISGQAMPKAFVRALITIKKAAARANQKLGVLDDTRAQAIIDGCDSLLSDANIMKHFPVDVFQTGSGTSSNMNANEVIAYLANKQSDSNVHPNDHVNLGQSSNDVIPTAIHVSAAIEVSNELVPALDILIKIIEEKAQTLSAYCKTGRTHLMDAMPIRMDQSIKAWASQLKQHRWHLKTLQARLHTLAQGGTAVGTGVNSHPEFATTFCDILTQLIGLEFTPAEDCFALISAQDTAVALSGVLKGIAITLMKIANDLRWMNSGPLAGLGEITLPALQPGSSIMPGKVNPVIPEAVAMAAAQVMGNDTTISIAGQSGNFELNVMLPLIANNLLTSLSLITNSAIALGEKAIRDFSVNQDNLASSLYKNPVLVTALNPIIGYAKAAEIAKVAYKEKKPVVEVAARMTDIPKDELEALLDPTKLTSKQPLD